MLLALQLPARPSNARVRAWRRLQQLGALPVKHAVYLLPWSPQALEDFSWLRTEVESSGGQAAVFSASTVEAIGDAEIEQQFRTARAADFTQFATELKKAFPSARRTRPDAKALRPWRERFEQLRHVDFFGAPNAADAEQHLQDLERRAQQPVDTPAPAKTSTLSLVDFVGRTWITRPRPGVDRFASAWLIRRFIDPDARVVFGAHPSDAADAVPFDMYDGVGFGHEGARCTFEVLVHRFGISDPVVHRLAELVHDVDLKDDRFHAPDAATLERLVQGLRASIDDDQVLLAQGIALFEALYRSMAPLKAGAPPRRARRTSRR